MTTRVAQQPLRIVHMQWKLQHQCMTEYPALYQLELGEVEAKKQNKKNRKRRYCFAMGIKSVEEMMDTEQGWKNLDLSRVSCSIAFCVWS